MKRSIFYRITQENENTSTEILANLMQNATIRELILKILIPSIPDEIIKSIENNSISTQKRIDGIGQPDLVISSNTSEIILENKTQLYTSPTNHEIIDYIACINKSQKQFKHLVFLIPRNYQFLQDFQSISDNNIDCSIVFWEDLIDEMREKELAEISPLFKESLEFLELLVLGDRAETLSWGIYEVAMLYTDKELFTAFKTVSLIHSLLWKSEKELVPLLEEMKIGKIWPSGWFPGNYQACYGKYLTINNKQFLYFGFNEKTPEKEYTFGIAIKSDIERYFNVTIKKEGMIPDSEGWFYYPVDRKIILENNPTLLAEAFAKAFQECMIKND